MAQSATSLTTVPGLPRWYWQTPWPTGYEQNDIAAFSAAEAWVAAGHGTLLHSADTGRTWTRRETGTTNDLLHVAFAPGHQTGWLLYNTPLTDPVRIAGQVKLSAIFCSISFYSSTHVPYSIR